MKNISHKFTRLPLAERILFFSSVFCLIFTFFPSWFKKVIPSSEVAINYNAYTGVTAAIWYFYAIFLISIIVIFILSLSNKKIKAFIEHRNWVYLFITGESLFLLVIALLVNMHYALQFVEASIGAGLVLCIIANILSLFSAHFYFLQRKNNKIRKEFINQMKPNISLDIDEITSKNDNDSKNSQMNFSDYK